MKKINKFFVFLILFLLYREKYAWSLLDLAFFKNNIVLEKYNELYDVAYNTYQNNFEYSQMLKNNAKFENMNHKLSMIKHAIYILMGLGFGAVYFKNFILSFMGKKDEKLVNIKKKLPIEFIGEEKLKRTIINIIEKSLQEKDTTGILLYGAPGTGKTELIKYVVNTLDLAYKIVLPSDILGMMMGESETNLKNLIEQARAQILMRNQPVVLIFDECEGLFGRRKDSDHEITKNLKNMMLQFMSGEMSIPGLIIVGITNNIDDLDSAFVRPGRFSHKFYLGNPDETNRQEIIDYYIKKHQLIIDSRILENILGKCEELSRADIRYLIEFISNYLEQENLENYIQEKSLSLQQNNDISKEKDYNKNKNKIKAQKIADNDITEKEHEVLKKILNEETWKVVWKEFLSSLSTDKNKFTYYPDASFANIAGYKEVKDELIEYIDELKAQFDKKTKMSGIIFSGISGVGKTELAKAFAGQAGVPLMVVKSSDIIDKYIGESEQNLKKIIEIAKKNTPCIILIDEIDGLFNKRWNGNGDYYSALNDNLVNLFLTYIDGPDTLKGVLIIGTTNHYEDLDQALVRSGRLDRKITLDVPNWFDRLEIIQYYLKKYSIAFDAAIPIESVADRLDGLTGADIKKYFELIDKKMKKLSCQYIDLPLYAEAYQEMLFGKREKYKYNMSEEYINQVLYHEAGHAVVQYICGRQGQEMYEFDFFTSVPRGSALGRSYGKRPSLDSAKSKDKVLGSLASALAGRAAEEVFFNMVTSGPKEDLNTIYQIAKTILLIYGMGQKFLYDKDEKDYNQEVNLLISKVYANVIKFLKQHKELIHMIVLEAKDKEIIFADQMAKIVDQYEKKIGKKVTFNVYD